MSLSFDAVLFDLDGTLLDTAGDVLATLKKTLNNDAFFDELSETEIHAICAYGSRHLYEIALKKKVSMPDYATFRAKLFEHYQQQSQPKACLFPGVASVIQALDNAQVPWGIVTNKQQASAVCDVHRFEVLKNCRVIVGFDTTDYPKPAPEPILYACDQLQVSPLKTVFVGDTMVDMEAAHHAGSIAVGVTYGHGGFDQARTFKPQYVIDQANQLVSLLFPNQAN